MADSMLWHIIFASIYNCCTISYTKNNIIRIAYDMCIFIIIGCRLYI